MPSTLVLSEVRSSFFMSPETARNLIHLLGILMLIVFVVLPPVLYYKYGVGRPQNLRGIGAALARQGCTLTQGKRAQNVGEFRGGALYAIRYLDAAGQEFEAIASVAFNFQVYFGEERRLSAAESRVPLQAPECLPGARAKHVDLPGQVPKQSPLEHLHQLQDENARLRQQLAELRTQS